MRRYLALQKIVQLGSFSKAAQSLGYTQSALSQMIASLEAELSVRLLERSRAGVTLSDEGKQLFPLIESMALQSQRILEKSQEVRGLETGVVRMATLASISAHWLPGLLRDFQALYPHVEFVIHQGDYDSIQEWIKTGVVDFGFVNPAAVSKLETEILRQGEMLAIVPMDHPLAQMEDIPLALLAKQPFILLEEGSYYEPLEAFKKAGLQPDVRFTLHDDYAIMAMVEAGLGVSILARLMLLRTHYQISMHSLVPKVFRTIAVAYKSREGLPAASRRFIEFLKEHLPQLP